MLLKILLIQASCFVTAHRKEKCIQSGRATIFEDYAFLPKHIPLKSPVYAVEIKPKQGFIPRLQKRFDKCTYCLNQYLKVRATVIQCNNIYKVAFQLQNGQIDRVSRYCPFDLFSGYVLCATTSAPPN